MGFACCILIFDQQRITVLSGCCHPLSGWFVL
jgi:hypothetical protein